MNLLLMKLSVKTPRDFARELVFVDRKQESTFILFLHWAVLMKLIECQRVKTIKKQAEKWLNDGEVMKGIWESMKHWFQNPKDILSEMFDDVYYNWLPNSFKYGLT